MRRLSVTAACSTIAWCCVLNLLWIVFTALGGVVGGIGPATVTACILARRRIQGESFHFGEFAKLWRREFVRGTAVILPVVAAMVVLLLNYVFLSSRIPGESAFRIATLITLAMTAGIGAYLGPMYAHYDLPLRLYLVKSTRFALARPVPTVILLFVLAAISFAVALAPVLLFTVAIGAWLHTSTWLCVRFFTENEDKLASSEPESPLFFERALPSEPLRIR